jgi:hypothetical protein
MCDPLTIASLAIGAAGTAANTIGRAGAQKKQESEFNSWKAYQDKARAAEKQRQESFRQEASAAQQKGLADIGAENQQNLQSAEEARLGKLYGGEGDIQASADPAVPTSVADAALTGQSGGGEVFQTDMARRLNDATASAKQRLKALATINSYGGSREGLGTVNPINQSRAGSAIDVANNYRRGSMAAYSTEHDVQPVQVSYSNPIADIAQSFLGAGMQGLGAQAAGGGLGSIFGNAIKPGVVSGATSSAWNGLRNVTLPGVAPLPTPRPIY